jgi:hypothetical protein
LSGVVLVLFDLALKSILEWLWKTNSNEKRKEKKNLPMQPVAWKPT